MKELAVDHYLVSTNGKRFKHPDAMAIRLVLDEHQGTADPVLCFNYETPQTELWKDQSDCEVKYGQEALLVFDTD